MSLPNPSTGDVVAATDVSSIKTHLEGGNTAPWLLIAEAGSDIVLRAAVSRAVRIQNSSSVDYVVFNSSGVAVASLILPLSAAPSQTADGSLVWDTATDRLTVGTGSSRKVFRPSGLELVGENTTEQTTVGTSMADLVTVTLTRSVPVTEGLRVTVSYRKSAGAAAAALLGLKLNTTVVLGATNHLAATSATNQAEDGILVFDIAPRSASYLTGIAGYYRTAVSASGAAAVVHTFTPLALDALLPNASLTSIVIRGNAVNALQTLGVKEVKVWAG